MSEEGISWPFEDGMMQDIFTRMKIRNVSWDEIKNYAENYSDQYKDDVLQEMLTLEALVQFDKVFYWGDANITYDVARHKLIDWIRKHKEFYNDDPEVIYNRMVEIIEHDNKELRKNLRKNQKWKDIKYINWLPRWGGMIRHNTICAEARFHKKQLANKFFLETNQDLVSESESSSDNEGNEPQDTNEYISPRQPMRPVEEDD